jgi:hypothetical protein
MLADVVDDLLEIPHRILGERDLEALQPVDFLPRMRRMTIGHRGEGTLHGLISIGDLVKDIISEQRFIIDQLCPR